MSQESDVIIIGSGVAGLCSAIALAKEGKKVLVLEQHIKPGGYLQSFSRKNWSFNIGTHYISSMRDADANNRIFNTITGKRLTFTPMDHTVETMRFADGTRFDFHGDKEEYINDLITTFPHEEQGIKQFFLEMEKVLSLTKLMVAPKLFSGFKHALLKVIFRLKIGDLKKRTVQEMFEAHIRDPKLRQILSLHCGKVLTQPEELSFLTYCLLQNSYFYGGSYPSGSGDAIITALVEELKQAGGELLCKTPVSKIFVTKNSANGVQLSDGSRLNATTIISNIGIFETYEHLIEDYCNRKRYTSLVSTVQPSRSYLTLYIGLKGDLTPFHIGNRNYRILSKDPYNFDLDPTVVNYSPSFATIVFPSLRDSQHKDSEYHTAEILIPTPFEHFKRWQNSTLKERHDSYSQFKESLTKSLLSLLNREFPGIKELVAFTNLSTPLTNAAYLKRKAGASSGILSTPEKLTSDLLHPKSDIKGLYFTGADIFSHGIIGCCIGGLITASNVEGKNLLNRFN